MERDRLASRAYGSLDERAGRRSRRVVRHLRVTPYGLEFPDFVHALARDEQVRVILVRQDRHGCSGHSLELAVGAMKPGKSILLAGRSDLKGKISYWGGEAVRLATLSVDPARHANRLHPVVVRNVWPGAPSPDDAEDIKVVAVAWTEAIRLAVAGMIVNAQHVGLPLLGLAVRGLRAEAHVRLLQSTLETDLVGLTARNAACHRTDSIVSAASAT